MQTKRYAWVCCYDICDKKRLAKVHKLVSMKGISLNYSVFYLYITLEEFEQLVNQLQDVITLKDDVRLYRCEYLGEMERLGEWNAEGIELLGK